MKCELCGEHDKTPTDMAEDIALMVKHFELFHPEHEWEKWPDGAPVVYDDTLTPEDFAGGAS